MRQLTPFELWHGRNEPPPEVASLRAGPLTLEFERGDLRYIRYGAAELVRRIYVAVRDVNWNTIPGRMENLSIEPGPDRFRITFDVAHRAEAIAYRWQARIEGTAEGAITYAMEGRAESDFRYCRIGFCLLHPIAGVAGSRYEALTPEGVITGVLPELVGPQPIVNGFEAPLFRSFSSLTVRTAFGMDVVTEFEGDLFEMEDQRNWTDGSFKTYCTPLALGYPHQARAGQVFRQVVTLTMRGAPAAPREACERAEGELGLSLAEASPYTLPLLGLGMAGHGRSLAPREADLLRRLQPDHLRAELHLQDEAWPSALARALEAAGQMACPLELALFLADAADAALAVLAERLRGAPVARVLVFHEAEAARAATSPRWLDLARRALSPVLPGVPFVGGTNANFAELNRQWPDPATMDGLCYTLNPQVHASDDRSLFEGLEGQGDTVLTARALRPALPVHVSAVTLRPPFNPDAREEEAAPDPNELPANVDPRQMSLLAAGWTVGSLNALSQAGPASLTYYETTGWRGLMETEEGSPLPQRFRSYPGMVFPAYWVFAFLAEAKGAQVLRLRSTQPLLLQGLALRRERRLWLAVANLQPRPQRVRLQGLPPGRGTIRRLNERTMPQAAAAPDAFAARSEPLAVDGGAAVLDLLPYETVFVRMS